MQLMRDVWDFYMGLFSSDPAATWIATIATATFLISFVIRPLFLRTKRKKPRLRVEADISYFMTVPVGIGSLEFPSTADAVIVATVTNIGESNCFICRLGIKTFQKRGFRWIGANPEGGSIEPVKLEPGEQYRHKFSIKHMGESLLQRLSNSDLLCIQVVDTKGSKYPSNKLEIKEFSLHIGVARDFNAKQE